MNKVLITFQSSDEKEVFIKIINKIREDKTITPLDEGFLTKSCSDIIGVKEIE